MNRRTFVTSLAGAGLVPGGLPAAGGTRQQQRQAPGFYIWRQYIIRNGTQPQRVAEYLQKAAVPALNRLGHTPIGVFEPVAGVPSPSVFVLIPCDSIESVGMLDERLADDKEHAAAGAGYLDATAADPAYVRQESSLLAAFPTVPRLEVPAATATKGPRLFELRTYESPTEKGHRLKVQMFDEMGEIQIFRKVGLTPVFFARTIVGPRMPNLTYMLVHADMAAREKSWGAFRTSPEWKKLSATPGYADREIVSNITTVFLRPAAYSQV